MTILQIRQDAPKDAHYPVRLTLKRHGQPALEAEANIEFALTVQEQEDIRWYLEDYLQNADVVEAVTVEQVEEQMKARGEELYTKVLAANGDTQALWFSIRNDLADLLNQIGQPFSPLLAAQGIDWSAINDQEERRHLVFQILRQFPVLWIWDNVEPVAGFPEGTESQWTAAEQQDLRDFLQQINLDTASKVKILLTSRRDEAKWLGGIPHRIAMLRMSNSDAAKLALKLGEEKKLKRSEIADWQPLLDYCGGNPLTLRVLVGQAVKAGLRGREQITEFVEAILTRISLPSAISMPQRRPTSAAWICAIQTTPLAAPGASSKSGWCITSASARHVNAKCQWKPCFVTSRRRKQVTLRGCDCVQMTP